MDFRHPFITQSKNGHLLRFVLGRCNNSKYSDFNFWHNGMNVVEAIVQVCAFHLSFAIIGTAIWYVIKFSTLENNSSARIVFAHIIAASIIIFIWMYFGIVMIKLFHPESRKWFEQNWMANRIFGGYMLYIIYVVFFYAVNYYNGFKEKLRNEGN